MKAIFLLKITANELVFAMAGHSVFRPANTAADLFVLPKITTNAQQRIGRVGQSISALAAHRTVRESLPSYGSCYSVNVLFLVASDKIISSPVVPDFDMLPALSSGAIQIVAVKRPFLRSALSDQ